jgi:hypothetical protein
MTDCKIGLMICWISIGLVFSKCGGTKNNVGESKGPTTYYIDPENGNNNYSGVNKTEAWSTFSKVNELQLFPGDRIEVFPGSFKQSLILKSKGTEDAPIQVHFAKGRYDFYPDSVFREKYNISNTNASPDSLKAVGILFKNAKNVEVSGEGAEIIYRGKMIEVCIDSSENITISNLHFDYYRPTVSEFTVVDVGEGFADLQIHKDSHYKIVDGNIIWYGEGWTCNTRMLGQELNLETNDVRRLWNPIEGMQFEEISPGFVKAKGNHKVKKDHVYQLRETFRDYAAVFTRRSKNITWKHVNFYFLHGMGLVSQFSENLTFDGVSIAPESTSGRTTAAWADILHFSGCKGKILVKDCIFNGAHDDAINIHGTYLQVVEKVSDNQLKVRFMHKQTYGFMAFNPGDEIDFIDGESYKSHGLNKVKEAVLINPKEMLLTLEKRIPDMVDLNDVIENITWTPEVEIRGSHVSRIPTRGFLVATRRKVLIEDNVFLGTHMSAILVAIDANSWYESGFVKDMTIQNNKFIRCAEPVIHIEPRNQKANDSVHQNITIVNNEFLLHNELIVEAKSAKGLVVDGNSIISEKKLDNEKSIKTSDCSSLKIGQNQYKIYSN